MSAAGEPQSAEERALRVLVVEDDERDAEMAVRAIRGLGVAAWRRVERADQLQACLDRERWDLVLSDFSLPGFDGFSALDLVRSSGLDLPFVVISGAIGDEAAAEIVNAGADNLVMKDNLGRLSRVVEAALHEARLRRARREADREIRAILYGLGDAVLATDSQGLVRHMNPVAEQLTGWTAPEAVGRPLAEVFRIVNEQTRHTVEDPVSQVIRRGTVVGLANHTLLIAKDGTERPIADSGAPMRDERGELTGVALVFRDQTAEREAEAALAEREAYGRAILDAVGSAVAVIDQHGVIQAVNAAWEQFARENGDPSGGARTGVGADYLAVTRAADAAAEGAADALAGIEAVLSGAQAMFQTEYPCHDPEGPRRWFVLQVTPLAGSRGGAVLAHFDITQRKLLELRRELAANILAALNRSHDLPKLLSDVVAMIREETGLEAVGLRLRDRQGYPFSESCGFPDTFAQQVGSLCRRDTRGRPLAVDDPRHGLSCVCGAVLSGCARGDRPNFTSRGSFWTAQASALRTGEGDETEPVFERHVCLDEGYESMAIIPLRAGEAVIGLLHLCDHAPGRVTADQVEFLEDISASIGIAVSRHKSAEQLLESRIELVRLLDEAEQSRQVLLSLMEDQRRADAERAELQERLAQQQRLESIGTLAGGVAHEINNPIMGVTNYAQLILDARPADEELQEYATEIIRETDRIATIVRNLLQFARQEQQSFSSACLTDIVEGTLSLVRTVMRHDQITLEVDVPEDLPPLMCRSQQLQQVIMNLLTNARDALNARYAGYHQDKLVRVSGEAFDRAGQTWLRVIVEDHGTGIPESVRDRIMEPFFTTKPRDLGTGLGLSISHGIVKDHQGLLVVETEPGEWTRFRVELPTEQSRER